MFSKTGGIHIKLVILALILIDVFLVVYSCQSRSGMNPIEGDLIPGTPSGGETSTNSPVYVTGEYDGDISTGYGSMGTYYVSIDTDGLTGEMTPIRNVEAVGDAFIVDITNFLNGSPCGDCFKMESIQLNSVGEILIDFSLRHPFGLPTNRPPADDERLDLHVFDTQAIFFFEDSGNAVTFPQISSSVLGPLGGAEIMESDNSGFWASQDWDGATNHFDDYVDGFWQTNSNLHPYLMFFEDSSRGNVDASDPNGITNLFNPSGHNVFPQGGGPDHQTVNFGSQTGGDMGFIVVISSAYGQSARLWGNELGRRGNPVYMLPEFNRKEPWKVDVHIPADKDMLSSGDTESSSLLQVYVYDWQHDYGTVVGDYDPLIDPKDSLRRASRVKGVYAEIPGVSNIDYAMEPVSGTGWGDDPLCYNVWVKNDLAALENQYLGMVGVTDDLHGTNLENYGVERDGITLFDMNQFVTYAMFNINVIDRGGGSFSSGFSMYGEDGSSQMYYGSAVSLDSPSGNNIAVFGNNVYVISSVASAVNGDGWDIFLNRSTDTGMNFYMPVMINQDWELGYLGKQSEPCISISPDTGYVHVTFTDASCNRYGVSKTQSFYRRSTDNGMTFSEPAIQLNYKADYVSDQAVIKAGSDGYVWAAFRRYTEYYPDNTTNIVICKSNDYGDTFTEVKEISNSPHNYRTPVVLTHPEPGQDPKLMAVVWRQANLNEPDINYVISSDGGLSFAGEMPLSSEGTNEYASNPRSSMDYDGNIFCFYKVNEHMGAESRIVISYGVDLGGYEYQFIAFPLRSAADQLFGDLDIHSMPSGNTYICWNQLDSVDTIHGQDVYVYKSVYSYYFEEYAHIQEPTEFFADQDMPRFAGNSNGGIYMIYRDNTYMSGGEIFFTHTYE